AADELGSVVMWEWLILAVIVAVTRAIHCYIHYRAGLAGLPMPSHENNEPVQVLVQEQATNTTP
ncbi:hypothetical protein BaRGS_00011543, partial [Batillaria attramentaria]